MIIMLIVATFFTCFSICLFIEENGIEKLKADSQTNMKLSSRLLYLSHLS